MSLLGRAGLDLRSWAKSLRASKRIIVACIIGFVIALLGLRILGTPANAFTVATVIWSRYPAWRVPFLLLAVATGVSMIILGLHFPSDVIGGVFLGIFCAIFVLGLAKLRSSK